MSLNWNFDKKVGKAIDKEGREYNIYCGNALMIMLYEVKDTYTLVSFWSDKEHAKNCLGISKNSDFGNIHNNIAEWHFFNTSDKYENKKIVDIMKLLVSAKWEEEIKITYTFVPW